MSKCFALENYKIIVCRLRVYSCAYRFVSEMDMMIGILDWNEPHELPMNSYFLFYSKEEKITNKDTARRRRKNKSKEIENETKQNDRGIVKIDIYIRAATSLCTPEIYFVLYQKNDTKAYFILLFLLLLPIAILSIHIHLLHMFRFLQQQTENYQILESSRVYSQSKIFFRYFQSALWNVLMSALIWFLIPGVPSLKNSSPTLPKHPVHTDVHVCVYFKPVLTNHYKYLRGLFRCSLNSLFIY